MPRSIRLGVFRHKTVTYLNVPPASNTEPIIEAQGWTRYSDGLFVAVPAVQWRDRVGPAVKIVGAIANPIRPVRISNAISSSGMPPMAA